MQNRMKTISGLLIEVILSQVCVAGHYITVLLDPNSYDSVLYDTKSLDFTRYKNQIIKRVFSLQLPNNTSTSEREWMER